MFHPARTAVLIASSLKVTPLWLFSAGGRAGGAGSLPATAAHPVWDYVLHGG